MRIRALLLLDADGPGSLVIGYAVQGDLDAIRLPEFDTLRHSGQLWTSTCFELFLRAADGRYVEWNFAPDGQWACYRFDSYRTGMRDHLAHPPALHVDRMGTPMDQHMLTVRLELGDLLAQGFDQAAISAILETQDGQLSYWALAHAAEKPDFHDPNCFVLPLGPGRGR